MRSLKEQNNTALWLITSANVLLLYGVLKTDTIQVEGLPGLFRQAQTMVPVGIAGVIATVLNALPSPDLKAALVYWHRRHALPGHRAFSVYASRDTRIDVPRLLKFFKGKFPSDPSDQNAAWYKLYRTVREDVTVASAHKAFLLLRDYTTLSASFLIVFGPWALVSVPNRDVALLFVAWLAAQYLIVRQAAYNAGIRLVTNVLAVKSATLR